jgi:hypothetical protein
MSAARGEDALLDGTTAQACEPVDFIDVVVFCVHELAVQPVPPFFIAGERGQVRAYSLASAHEVVKLSRLDV